MILVTQSDEISLREISTHVLERAIQYCYYKVKYTNTMNEIPPFEIDPEISYELLSLATLLNI